MYYKTAKAKPIRETKKQLANKKLSSCRETARLSITTYHTKMFIFIYF